MDQLFADRVNDVKVPLHGATLLRNNVACNIVLGI